MISCRRLTVVRLRDSTKTSRCRNDNQRLVRSETPAAFFRDKMSPSANLAGDERKQSLDSSKRGQGMELKILYGRKKHAKRKTRGLTQNRTGVTGISDSVSESDVMTPTLPDRFFFFHLAVD